MTVAEQALQVLTDRRSVSKASHSSYVSRRGNMNKIMGMMKKHPVATLAAGALAGFALMGISTAVGDLAQKIAVKAGDLLKKDGGAS